MPSSIVLSDNGASSGSAGIKTSGGNDGVLILQTTTSGGTATNAVYINNTQQVGMGTSTPGYRLEVKGPTGNGMGYNDGTVINYMGTSGSAIAYTGTLTNHAVGFLTNGIERFRATTSGNLQFITADAGIVFNKTGALNSSTLNDYEEGTFTPTVLGFSTPGTGTYNGRLGRYTRVGNRVYIQMWVDWTNLTGASGALGFGGLPFTAPNTAYVYNALVCYMDGSVTLSANNVIQCYIPVNDSRVLITQYATGGGPAATIPLDSSGAVMVCGWYEPA